MRICFCAQLPPPVHGQNLMNEITLDCLGQLEGVDLVKVPFQFSKSSAQTGRLNFYKWKRFRETYSALKQALQNNNLDAVYYVPAPPRLLPCLRDYFLLKLINKHQIPILFHIHAVGLGERFKQSSNPIWKLLLNQLRHHTVFYLSPALKDDATGFQPSGLHLLPNAVACPGDPSSRVERRRQRIQSRKEEGDAFRLLFLGALTRDKGLWQAAESLQELSQTRPNQSFELHLAGEFPQPDDELKFKKAFPDTSNLKFKFHGFLPFKEKWDLLFDCDSLLFPSRYPFEGAPLVVLEAMAAGCLPLLSNWRALPDLLPPNYPGVVDFSDPDSLSATLAELEQGHFEETLIQHFDDNYSLAEYHSRLASLISISR